MFIRDTIGIFGFLIMVEAVLPDIPAEIPWTQIAVGAFILLVAAFWRKGEDS